MSNTRAVCHFTSQPSHSKISTDGDRNVNMKIGWCVIPLWFRIARLGEISAANYIQCEKERLLVSERSVCQANIGCDGLQVACPCVHTVVHIPRSLNVRFLVCTSKIIGLNVGFSIKNDGDAGSFYNTNK